MLNLLTWLDDSSVVVSKSTEVFCIQEMPETPFILYPMVVQYCMPQGLINYRPTKSLRCARTSHGNNHSLGLPVRLHFRGIMLSCH